MGAKILCSIGKRVSVCWFGCMVLTKIEACNEAYRSRGERIVRCQSFVMSFRMWTENRCVTKAHGFFSGS